MSYFNELKKAMEMIAVRKNSVFLGQAVEYPGTAIYNTLKDIDIMQRWEMPVTENMQLGMSIGLSLQGYLPVSIFPRMDFLVSAMDQLVNHLDKLEAMSSGEYKPKVIIRTSVGSTKPLHPNVQHCQDHTVALRHLLTNVNVLVCHRAIDIIPIYEQSIGSVKSSLIVEFADRYNDEE